MLRLSFKYDQALSEETNGSPEEPFSVSTLFKQQVAPLEKELIPSLLLRVF